MKDLRAETRNVIKDLVNIGLDTTGNQPLNDQIILHKKHNNKKLSAFFSYGSLIAFKYDNQTYVTGAFTYSSTTSKHKSIFLGETTSETIEKLKNSEYIYLEEEELLKCK